MVTVEDGVIEERASEQGPWRSGDASDDPTRVERPGRASHPQARARVITPPPLPPPPYAQYPHSGVRSVQRDEAVREGDVLAGKYLVEHLVGRTGPALVLRVRHVELGQRMLLKFLPHEACAFPDTVARFLQGSRAALQLTSSHAVRTLDAGRLSSGLPYLVTEHLEGSSLREMLRVTGGLQLSEAVDWTLQAAIAVAEAHRYGIAHGNLNPSTLFVADAPDGSPLIKVTDFGIADALRSDPLGSPELRTEALTLDESNRAVEALACTAPEQVRRVADADPRTDVWALGAVLHEMLTGFPVYYADTVPGILAMIVADPAPPITSFRTDVPAALERVILRCLEKERSGRFASVAELAVALKPFASPEGQALADRVTRTLGRPTNRAGTSAAASRAIVRVAPASPGPPALAEPLGPPPLPWAQRYQLVWSAALIAFGLFGGLVGGSVLAARNAPPLPTASPAVAAQAPMAVASAPAEAGAASNPAVAPQLAAASLQVPTATIQPGAPGAVQRVRPAYRSLASVSRDGNSDRAESAPPKTASASKTLFDDMR